MAWTFGSLYGLHEEVVGVGFIFINPNAFADIHLPLYIPIIPGYVNIKMI